MKLRNFLYLNENILDDYVKISKSLYEQKNINEIIKAKRDCQELTTEQIEFFIKEYSQNKRNLLTNHKKLDTLLYINELI